MEKKKKPQSLEEIEAVEKKKRAAAAEKDRIKSEKKARRPKITPLRVAGTVFGGAADTAVSTVGLVFKILGTILLILVTTGLLFTCIFAVYVKMCLNTSFELDLDEQKINKAGTIWYQDAAGDWRVLSTMNGTEKRIWVNYESIPEDMEHALVAIEDKRFYDHKGVDWYRTSGAFFKMFLTMENSFGGSSITQQLIKNRTGNDEITVKRKLVEIFGALELEKIYDKKEIIEWYLNSVYFGEGCYGVQAAAETYFGKDVSDLTAAECAAIVGITNKPTYYDPFYSEENNKKRKETILYEMYDQGYLDYKEYKEAMEQELVFVHSQEEDNVQEIYSYYAEVVMEDVIQDLMELKGVNRKTAHDLLFNSGYQIYSCMDARVQANIDYYYTDTSKQPQVNNTNSGQMLQSAIVIMDPYTGEVVGLSGGVGEKKANFILDRATTQRRPSGSSFKPVAVYAPAIEYGLITPATKINDERTVLMGKADWFPNNYDHMFRGIIDMETALRLSLNTVSARIIDRLTPQVSYNFLTQKLGFTSLTPDDCDYAPLSLGQQTYGVTVLEMCQAFSAFVNDGKFIHARTYSMVTDANGNVIIDNSPRTIQAMSANTAHVMTYMLEQAVVAGTGAEADFYTHPVAGKTGTTSDEKDRWFVGCTPYYACAVWTGYDMPAVIHASGNPAAYLFRKVMGEIHNGLPFQSFIYPMLGADTKIFGDFDYKAPEQTVTPYDELQQLQQEYNQPYYMPENPYYIDSNIW